MGNPRDGEIVKKCASLTWQESDAIFYPGPGGKSNKAKAFCADCPFKSQCLIEAINEGLEGFVAGTTLDERKEIAVFITGISKITLISMDDYAPSVPPPVGQNSTGRRIKRKISNPDPYAYLDELEPAIEELVG